MVNAAKASVVLELLTVLDDLDRARAHGDLVGSFGAVADKLTGALTKLGLKPVGAVGDPFDPAVHEAVQFGTSTEVSEPTVTAVFRSGYSLGERAGPAGGRRGDRAGARECGTGVVGADCGRRGVRIGLGRPVRRSAGCRFRRRRQRTPSLSTVADGAQV